MRIPEIIDSFTVRGDALAYIRRLEAELIAMRTALDTCAGLCNICKHDKEPKPCNTEPGCCDCKSETCPCKGATTRTAKRALSGTEARTMTFDWMHAIAVFALAGMPEEVLEL